MSRSPSLRRQVVASVTSSDPVRRVAAGVLVRASVALERLASVVGPAPPPDWTAAPATIEFHAGDDGSGGALYVDGVLVGFIDGVRRL